MLEDLVRLAGWSHLLIVAAAAGIPSVLQWRTDLLSLRPMNRQLFRVYAGYIVLINLAFAAVSLAWPEKLASGTGLAAALAGFIALFWAIRLVLQLFVLDRSDWPRGALYSAAHWGFTCLFAFHVGVYGSACVGGWLR